MRLFFLLLMFMAVAPKNADAKEFVQGPLVADVIRVMDGDTLEVRAHVWIGQHIKTIVRLNQIDTPELRAKCLEEKQLAQNAKEVLSQLVQDQQVVLKNIQYGKYAGRVVADVETRAGVDLSAVLIEKGVARPYSGKKRTSWCD